MSHRSRHVLLLGFIAFISLAFYLLFAFFTFRIGFPLDDAWIHQTYARNFAEFGEWSFVPNTPSAGSTAPLWSAIIAIGYALELEPYFWTFLIGWLSLWGISIVGYFGFRSLLSVKQQWAIWVGGSVALEWHLVWAAGSGMETLLFALMASVVLVWLVSLHGNMNLEGWKSGRMEARKGGPGGSVGRPRRSGQGMPRRSKPWKLWIGLGALVGLSVWLRPDGITLLGPAGFVILMGGTGLRRKLHLAILIFVGFSALFVPYLALNHALAGSWWPNTFYAKQTEYEILRQMPLWRRVLSELSLPLVGVGALLSPGFVYILYLNIKRRSWSIVAGGLWVLGYLGLYAWRLPVTYQHGRYVIPAMPAFFILGFAGMVAWIKPGDSILWRRVISRTWVIALGVVLTLFWIIGAGAYARDVAVIESEMVRIAQWINVNTNQDDLIAAHDIGALGYYGQRELLDLAGLVSPEVMPFIRDETRLAKYLDSEGANYLVTFPEWYPNLIHQGQKVFQTSGRFSPALGGENMAVYQWHAHR